MTKEIMVSLSGIQFEIEPSEPVELITTGDYYYKNEKHYILFEEIDPEAGTTKNRIKITPNKVEVVKSGSTNAQMIFEEGKTNLTYYDTAVGSLLMGITTDYIKITEEENRIKTKVRYSLEINYSHISDCEITIDVKARQGQ